MLRRISILVLIWTAIVALLAFVDPALWKACKLSEPEHFRQSDVHQVLRQGGHLLTWGLIAWAIGMYFWRKAAAKLPEKSPAPIWHAVLIFASPLLSGGLAELLKRLVGRERPGAVDPSGVYTFKPFLHAFADTTNLGLPSSHAAVAFGGAFMLMRLFPGAGWVALLWAIGCGVTRILLGAHYVSDVVAGAALGHISATFLSQFIAPISKAAPMVVAKD
jgi:membrane-associated phospholipid phosphatase